MIEQGGAARNSKKLKNLDKVLQKDKCLAAKAEVQGIDTLLISAVKYIVQSTKK